MEILEFEAQLERHAAPHAWIYVQIPFDVKAVFGAAGPVPIHGTINGVPYKSSLRLQKDGAYHLIVNQRVRKTAGVDCGDWVYVSLEEDVERRFSSLPVDFMLALESNHEAREAYESMSFAHQQEIVEWILEAKDYELRERRIQLALVNMPEGKIVLE